MLAENVALTQPVDNPRRRIRRASHHRGWSAAMRTPACIARDIATSILLHETYGNYGWVAEHYTDDAEIIALVNDILER